MTDTSFVDMAPFLEGHERRTRRIFIPALCVSLVLSAVIFMRGVLADGAPDAGAYLWLIMAHPLLIFLLWVGPALHARKRLAMPDGSLPINADDARNIARVANAGGVFVTGMYAVMVAIQALFALRLFGVLPSLDMDRDWVARAVLLATGALSIYFGNVWPRMPTPRAPEQHPAAHIKYNRFGGWLTVIFGLLLGLAAFLPFSAIVPVVVAAGILIIVGTVASVVRLRLATRRI